jgi:phosphatidylglycerol---prolipoprotein diacylglyceryl transferase
MPIIVFPYIDPIAVSLGPIHIYWYALAYVFGILFGSFYAKKIADKFKLSITPKQLDDFTSYAILGIVIGGRIGYVLFYNPVKYLTHPIEILKVYEGGMSFHGGMAGALVALYIYCKHYKISFLAFTDILAVIAPIGLFLGRLANFINAELYGRVTDVPWGVIFPGTGGNIRHPSQLYEALCEGILLFIIINYLTFKYQTLKRPGFNTGMFLILYSLSRIIIENFREPDYELGLFGGFATMGQILSLPMLWVGVCLLTLCTKKVKM